MLTTDNQNELFDVVNEQDEVIGQATRYQCHHNPKLMHRAVDVIVVNKDKQIFLQKRSLTKDTQPGKWTLSASGHLDQGETYQAAAVREAKEELGLNILPNELIEIGKKIYRIGEETEIGISYLLKHNGPFSLNTLEIAEGGWFSFDEVINFDREKGTPVFLMIIEDKNLISKLKKYL